MLKLFIYNNPSRPGSHECLHMTREEMKEKTYLIFSCNKVAVLPSVFTQTIVDVFLQ